MENKPPFPQPLAYLWDLFWEILSGCAATGMGPATIGWSDLKAWQEVAGCPLRRRDARMLVKLASIRVRVLSEE